MSKCETDSNPGVTRIPCVEIDVDCLVPFFTLQFFFVDFFAVRFI